MSRFDLDDDGDGHQITWEMAAYNLQRHLASPRGRAKLQEFRDALLTVPGHRLIDDALVKDGETCAVGAYAAYKRTQQGKAWSDAIESLREQYQPVTRWGWADEVDAWQTQDIGVRECGLTRTLAWHLGYANDETYGGLTPEARWEKFYQWTCEQLGARA